MRSTARTAAKGSDLWHPAPVPQYHLQISDGDVGGYVLLPGDPARAPLIASRFEEAREVARNREFCTWTGSLGGTPVSVCSTGIGSPSTAIAFEELCNAGAHTLIRVGTCGGLQPSVHRGDLVVMNAAVREDGTSAQYVPVEFPAVADLDCVLALRDAALASGATCHVGTTVSVDSFYTEIEPEGVPLGDDWRERWQAWIRAGALAAEMECGALYIAAAVRRVRAAAICLCVDESHAGEMPEHGAVSIDPLLAVSVDALRRLIARDR